MPRLSVHVGNGVTKTPIRPVHRRSHPEHSMTGSAPPWVARRTHWLSTLGGSRTDPPFAREHVQAESNPKSRGKAVVSVEQPRPEEQADPDADGANRDAGDEGPDHPTSMVDQVAAADCSDGNREAGHEPAAEDSGSHGFAEAAPWVTESE